MFRVYYKKFKRIVKKLEIKYIHTMVRVKDIEKSMNAGMVDYMTKPISIKKIIDMIRKWN